MSGDVAPVSTWRLERYLLGELPLEEHRALAAALEADERLRERLSTLERSNVEILREHPPAAVAARVQARAQVLRPRVRPAARLRPVLAAAAAIAVAALLVTTSPRVDPRIPATDGDAVATRTKGAAAPLLLYRQGNSSAIERLPSGSVVRAGDILQVAYRAHGRRYGVIVSVDGRGAVTRHLPAQGTSAAALADGIPVPLAQAYRLDDAPGFERFYLILADHRFDVRRIVEAVQRKHGGAGTVDSDEPLRLPRSFDQFTVVVNKELSQ
jgi:hypothetical protein